MIRLPSKWSGYAKSKEASEFPRLWDGLEISSPFGLLHGQSPAFDMARKRNDGTLNGSFSWGGTHRGPGLVLNSTDAYVSLPDQSFPGTFTFVWTVACRSYATLKRYVLIGQTINDQNSVELQIESGGATFRIWIRQSATFNIATAVPVSLMPDSTLHSIAVRRDDSNTVTAWLDGANITNQSVINSENMDMGASSTVATLGRRANSYSDITILEFHAYKRPLDGSEIGLFAQNTYAPFFPRRRIYGFTVAGGVLFPPNSLALTGVGR